MVIQEQTVETMKIMYGCKGENTVRYEKIGTHMQVENDLIETRTLWIENEHMEIPKLVKMDDCGHKYKASWPCKH